MRATYKEVKEIIKNTPDYLKGANIYNFREIHLQGYYTPSNANWSYHIYSIIHNDRLHNVVALFGYIE